MTHVPTNYHGLKPFLTTRKQLSKLTIPCIKLTWGELELFFDGYPARGLKPLPISKKFVTSKKNNKQTNKQSNRQTNKQTKTKKQNKTNKQKKKRLILLFARYFRILEPTSKDF